MRLALRHALVRHLGKELTPAACANIESSVCGDLVVPADAGVRIINDAWLVHEFVRGYFPISAEDGMRGIGLARDGALIAGVLYTGYTDSSIWMHVAAVPGRRWLNREYLRACFHYPFVELGLNQVLGWVESTNDDAIRFDTSLGFTEAAVLPQAGRNGADVTIYRMKREECRYA